MFGVKEEASRLIEEGERLEAKEKDLNEREYKLKLDRDNFESQKGQVYKTMELEFKAKLMDETEKVRKDYDEKLREELADNFEKLKSSLTNLHEEGNANTKYLEKITLKMMENVAPRLTEGRSE